MNNDKIQQTNDISFEQDVIKANKPVLIDFWAEWCGPCKMITPILNEISLEYKERLLIFKLNVDENTIIPTKFSVRGIPSLLLFNKGNLIATKVGALSKAQLMTFIDENL